MCPEYLKNIFAKNIQCGKAQDAKRNVNSSTVTCLRKTDCGAEPSSCVITDEEEDEVQKKKLSNSAK